MARLGTHLRLHSDDGDVEALIYTRVSSEEQAKEGISLPAQLAQCRRYAKERGWVVGREYQDVLSGKRDDRPEYQQMLTDVAQMRSDGKRAVVVVARLDRLGRRILERVRSREALKEMGVAIHTQKEGGEVSDLVANVLASVAEEEVRQLGERVSDVIRHAAERGWHPIGKPTWGYTTRPATAEERAQGAPKAVLVAHPVEAPLVREAFERVAAGETIRSVAKWAASLSEAERGGRRLTHPTVQFLLKSPTYIGRAEDKGGKAARDVSAKEALTRTPGHWEPLVSDDVWAKVQARRESHRHMPRQASNNFLLTGLVRCPRPECGERMVATGTPSKPSLAHRRPRYVCSALKYGTCTWSCQGQAVEDAVLNEVNKILDLLSAAEHDARVLTAVRRKWQELGRQTMAASAEQQRRAQRLSADLEKAKKRLADGVKFLSDGVIDREAYDAMRAEVEQDKQAIAHELESLGVAATVQEAWPSIDELVRDAGGWRQMMADSSLARKRDVLGALIESVVPERLGHARYSAHVNWKPLGERLYQLAESVAAAPA